MEGIIAITHPLLRTLVRVSFRMPFLANLSLSIVVTQVVTSAMVTASLSMATAFGGSMATTAMATHAMAATSAGSATLSLLASVQV